MRTNAVATIFFFSFFFSKIHTEWISLTDAEKSIYNNYLELNPVHRIGREQNEGETSTKQHYLAKYVRLRQICSHPHLLKSMLVAGDEGLDGEIQETTFFSSENPLFLKDASSSKLDYLLKKIFEIRDTTEDKMIVVSQSTSLLDIIDHHLKKHGFGETLMLIGGAKKASRNSIVNNINYEKKGPRVIILFPTYFFFIFN